VSVLVVSLDNVYKGEMEERGTGREEREGTYESWVPSPTLPQWGFGSFPFLPHDRVREYFLKVSTERKRGSRITSNGKETWIIS
jgi:hypothetical protein